MRKNGSLTNDQEVNFAANVAARGAVVGAAKWGIFSLVAGGVAWNYSPVFRNLTFQFKVFLGMSFMVLGSMMEADRRLREHEVRVRTSKKILRDAEVWRRYEEDYASSSSSAQASTGTSTGTAPAATVATRGSGGGGRSGIQGNDADDGIRREE